MSPIVLIDGNNLGHALGYINKASAHYDSAGLLSCLDGLARYLSTQHQDTETILFLDDIYAAERLGGWHVQVAPVPSGDADAAIRAYARVHAERVQILVSSDRALCGDVAVWGVVCIPIGSFITHYLVPARQAGFIDRDLPTRYVTTSSKTPSGPKPKTDPKPTLQGKKDRQRHAQTLAHTEALLRGEPLPPPETYRLYLDRWEDEAELALYLAERHLCPEHADLTTPANMIAAIQHHCSQEPRYFTAGHVVDRVFRLFLCRPEHTLSLDDLARLAQTRRRKVRAVIEKYGDRLGILPVWG